MSWPKRFKNKYGAKKTTCHQGHSHPSMLEADYCDTLHLVAKSDKRIRSIEYNKPYDLSVNGVKICVHRPDWTVMTAEGVEVHEAKGMPTPSWRLKKKLFEALYPNIKYVVIR